jgi:formylglycine-generating enzyme required for sulfatase activity
LYKERIMKGFLKSLGFIMLGLFVVSSSSEEIEKNDSNESNTIKQNIQSQPAMNFNYDTDVLNIEWIRVPAGEFLMGDNFGDGAERERPVHAVYLSNYLISKYEVTFDQFDAYCEETGYPKPPDAGYGRGSRPAINISWYAAQGFCDWLSGKTGKNIHLPTEAQWEKAARGTDQRRYPWGNALISCALANCIDCNGKTMPVGSYPSGVSPYGVHDMAGNVYEWCQDWFSPIYYSESPYYNPQGPLEQYPDLSYNRVMRGGSCCDPRHHCRSYQRPWSPPPDMIYDNIGFRIVDVSPEWGDFKYAGSWTGAGRGDDGWYVGDFNGDTKDDIFRYVAGVTGAGVFLSNGTKFVSAGSWTGAGHGTDGWYVGDFNGDGRDDIFRYVAGVSGAQVFLSDDTKFNYSGSWTGAGHGTDGWYIGDFNKDGRDDIFRYMPGVSGAQVFLSDGTKFALSGSWTGAGHGTDGWYIGDFNKDGRDDIFRYVPGVSGAQVFVSDGTKFVLSGSWTGAGHGADGWYVGDYNGDGLDDIFRYLPGTSGADVFLATWTVGSTAASISAGDTTAMDEDMMLDVYGARQMELSFDEEAALLAPFATRMMMGEEVSIYEIKAAYEQRVARVVRLVEIRQMLQRHGYWDLEGQVGRVKEGGRKDR